MEASKVTSENLLIEMGKRAKARREELGLSLAEVTKLMGYKNRSTLSRIESGQLDPPLSRLEQLAEILNVNPAYLACWTDDPTPSHQAKPIEQAVRTVLADNQTLHMVSDYSALEQSDKVVVNTTVRALLGKNTQKKADALSTDQKKEEK